MMGFRENKAEYTSCVIGEIDKKSVKSLGTTSDVSEKRLCCGCKGRKASPACPTVIVTYLD